MQYTVMSQDRPQNSPLYSVSTGLDSFIMFNDEALSEKIALSGLMADREEEVNTTELSKQSVEPLNHSKPNIGLELQVMHPLLLNLDTKEYDPQMNENQGESKHLQLSADIQQQSESTLVKEDIHLTDETENSPL